MNINIVDDLLPIPWEHRDAIERIRGHTIERVVHPMDWGLEGFFLGHCLGTKDVPEFSKIHRIFSIRDRLGIPHATILLSVSRILSPYGLADDFGNSEPVELDGETVHLLQVRGRQDMLARREYHQIARDWWRGLGGEIHVGDRTLNTYCFWRGDKDKLYHYSGIFDPERNLHRTTHHKEVEAWQRLFSTSP